MLDELVFSCGTPSKKVVIDGFAGLAPMPRNRALLSFRAVNSVKWTFGAKTPASLTIVDAGVLQRRLRDRRQAEWQGLRVGRLLLRGDDQRRQLKGGRGLSRPAEVLDCAQATGRQKNGEHMKQRHTRAAQTGRE